MSENHDLKFFGEQKTETLKDSSKTYDVGMVSGCL